MDGILVFKRAGAEVGRLDIGGAAAANGFVFGPDNADEVIVTVGYTNGEGVNTNVTGILHANGVAIGGAGRTGEQAVSQEFFAAVPE